MKKLLVPVLLFIGINLGISQTGFHAEYTNPNFSEWSELLPDEKTSFTFGVDYWFRLKNVRIEFFPEATLGSYNLSTIESINNFSKVKTDHLGVHFNTNFYIFDLAGDCDCPTFSKEGNSFQKGFFLQVGPGISYFKHTLTNETSTRVENIYSDSDVGFSINLGAGIDIGMNDFLTITPLFRIKHAFRTEGTDFTSIIDPDSTINLDKTSLTSFNFGLRFGLRWDELRR